MKYSRYGYIVYHVWIHSIAGMDTQYSRYGNTRKCDVNNVIATVFDFQHAHAARQDQAHTSHQDYNLKHNHDD